MYKMLLNVARRVQAHSFAQAELRQLYMVRVTFCSVRGWSGSIPLIAARCAANSCAGTMYGIGVYRSSRPAGASGAGGSRSARPYSAAWGQSVTIKVRACSALTRREDVGDRRPGDARGREGEYRKAALDHGDGTVHQVGGGESFGHDVAGFHQLQAELQRIGEIQSAPHAEGARHACAFGSRRGDGVFRAQGRPPHNRECAAARRSGTVLPKRRRADTWPSIGRYKSW